MSTPSQPKAQPAGLRSIVERYMAMYPVFRMKPEGAPGSQARDEQERKMALEDAARAALTRGAP